MRLGAGSGQGQSGEEGLEGQRTLVTLLSGLLFVHRFPE